MQKRLETQFAKRLPAPSYIADRTGGSWGPLKRPTYEISRNALASGFVQVRKPASRPNSALSTQSRPLSRPTELTMHPESGNIRTPATPMGIRLRQMMVGWSGAENKFEVWMIQSCLEYYRSSS